MKCPICNTENSSKNKFCLSCGQDLTSLATFGPSSDPLASPSASDLQNPRQYTNSNLQKASDQSGGAIRVDPNTNQPASATIATMNIWGPFAGYGSRRRHVGWLMDNKGEHVDALIARVREKFSERRIPNTSVSRRIMKGQGVFVEERPFFILKRGLATMALYISRFGNDLYVSQASYLKPPISNLRVIILGLMMLFWAYMTYFFTTTLNNEMNGLIGSLSGSLFGGGISTGNLATLLCIIGPLGTINNIALLLFMIFSIYKFITEKDLLAGLRTRPNEFNEDDLMAMEKAVEQSVRICLDEIGLDPEGLKPVYSSTDNNSRIF